MSRNNRNVTNNAKVKNNSTINNIKTRLNIMNSIKEKFGFSVMSNNKNNSNNNTNKGFMTKFEGNKTYLIIAAILLLIILIVAGIFIYRYMKSKRKVYVVTKNYIPYIHDAFIEKVIPYGSLPASSEGNEYNINVWLYINEYENMQQYPKPIIYIGNPDNLTNDDPTNHSSSNPSIWLRKGENTLRVVVGLDTEYGKEIDKYDYVIRCNEGEIEGYEKHVGSRADFRVIGKKTFTNQNLEAGGFPSRWNWLPKLKNEHFIIGKLTCQKNGLFYSLKQIHTVKPQII